MKMKELNWKVTKARKKKSNVKRNKHTFPEVPEGSQSRASLVDNHFLYSCDLNFWFKGVIVGKNKMLATPRSWRCWGLRR